MRHDSQFKSAGDGSAHVETELAAIEADPAFARAPVIRRLLRYLASESLAGRGATLKSYTVAVEGLGKNPDFDAQSDSYPRVQVGRLRKMLNAHYSEHAPAGGGRISIPCGGYSIAFDAAGQPETSSEPPALPPVLPARLRAAMHTISPVGLAIAAIASVVIAVYGLFGDAPRASGWTTHNFPIVVIDELSALDGTPEQRAAAADLRSSLSEMLSRFDTVDVAEPPAANAQYRLEGSLRGVPKGTLVQLSLTEMKSGKVIWARSPVGEPAIDRLFDAANVASDISGELAQPSGVIHSNQRARRVSTGTPYGCWLEFMTFWSDRSAADEKVVRTCVARWNGGDPSSSLAHSASSALLIEDARGSSGEARREMLSQAKEEALRAIELDPQSAFGHSRLMTAAHNRGELSLMRASANRIMELNPNNPELAALVALHRVLAGDIDAAADLKEALADHSNPSHWFYTGLFFAAVMNDDAPAAMRAAQKLQSSDPAALQSAALAMAEARMGRVESARRHWRQAVALDPSLAGNPNALLATWPVSSAIRERSMAWLKPVL